VPWEEPGPTAIVVLTPEAEPLAGAVYREHSNAGREGMTPHVTLVVPIEALTAEFPDYPPYEGIHDDVVPHVTVAESQDRELLDRIRSELEPRLPIDCRAAATTLVERGSDLRWRPRMSYPLGSLE
jgi:hypothetical protein